VNVFQLSRQFKAALIAREKQAALQMLRRYHDAYAGILAQLGTLTDTMDAARLEGETISQAWLFRERRLQSLLEQTRFQMAQFGAYAGGAVKRAKYEAAIAAAREALELTEASLGVQISASWSTLPVRAIESIAGTFERGSPVDALFAAFPDEAAGAVRRALIVGVATGQGPRAIARTARDALGEPLTRALTISRTETMRAYREASIASYAANPEVVQKWRWTATKTTRTCIVCILMDGQEFDFDTPFGSHVGCRCVPTPVTASWEELGIEGVEETRPTMETGAEWFARQPAEKQREVLGDAKYDAFKAGQFSLRSLVGYSDDPKWGPSRYERSLKSLTPV
jgi:SPP1 gp7 family putative phage head morphogenesis protein